MEEPLRDTPRLYAEAILDRVLSELADYPAAACYCKHWTPQVRTSSPPRSSTCGRTTRPPSVAHTSGSRPTPEPDLAGRRHQPPIAANSGLGATVAQFRAGESVGGEERTELHFQALKRLLDRSEADYAS